MLYTLVGRAAGGYGCVGRARNRARGDGTRTRGGRARRLFRHAVAEDGSSRRVTPHTFQGPPPFELAFQTPPTRAPEQRTFLFAVHFAAVAAVQGADRY